MISVLRITFKTNIVGNLKNETYDVNNSENNMNQSIDLKIPKKTLLFSDLIPIESKYFPKDKIEYLQSLIEVQKFNDIINNKLKDYKKKNRKDYKMLHKDAEMQRIPYYNIHNILERIFKTKDEFYLNDNNIPLTLINYFWNGGYQIDEIEEKGKKFRLYEINVILELDNRQPSQIDDSEAVKFKCKNQKEKIKRIYYAIQNINYLPTFKDEDIKKQGDLPI